MKALEKHKIVKKKKVKLGREGGNGEQRKNRRGGKMRSERME